MAVMRNTWGYSICGELIFGKHALEKLGKIAKRLGGKDIFIITDPTIHKMGHLEKAAASLHENGLKYEVFDRGEPEPSIEKVLECTEIASRESFCYNVNGKCLSKRGDP